MRIQRQYGIFWEMSSGPTHGRRGMQLGCPFFRGLCGTTKRKRKNPACVPVYAAQDEGSIHPASITLGGKYQVTSAPPMGMRIRLKSSYDISGFSPQMR